MVYRLNQYWTN